ncbi:Disease resistance protein RGA2 [Rhynchospora pubera]|uniref:Disease resistance protein RGA2 n=1 Tax=Rhynchospora pubera TaxID=906938 RepID=A0AAV8HB20_9POAL|nr:Disease resistance protein RGA2 [Rhynchospora pubera]
MTGVEETVAGWFASSIIGKVIDVVGSYLHNNYSLQSRTAEMLSSLENSLPQIQAAIGMASKMPTKNSELIKWMDNLKNAAYEIKDVLDDFEAKRILESLKEKNKVIESGKFVKSLFLPDKELKRLESAVEIIGKISMEAMNLIDHLRNEYNINANTFHTNTHRKETSSFLDPNAKIFGRDVEIYFILDMILDYHFKCFSNGNSEPESQPTPPSDGVPKLPDQRETKGTSSSMGLGQESKGKRKRSSSICAPNDVCIRNWKLNVLPICGLGGVGKTAVAKMVYNSDIVKECFDQRAWVYVPEQFDVKLLMKKILDAFRGDSSSPIDTELNSIGSSSIDTMINSDTIVRQQIERKLANILLNLRFFLILDDVHDEIESIWTDIFSVLCYGAPGSFVLVTTQCERVAKAIGNVSNIITLGVLEPDWFDLLFRYYAFGGLFDFDPKRGTSSISRRNNIALAESFNLDDEKLSALELIATKIATKLHGLPLAGKVIGKLLHTRLERVYWEEILRSDWWNEECALEGILPSLGIGYINLDRELKECFKFCSIFPKHYVFDRNMLVQMWMAHDFVQPNKEESFQLDIKKIGLEDVGRKCLINWWIDHFFRQP